MMATFPARIRSSDGEQHTGLICPNCGGAIRVRAEGARGTLAFECMVGHLYALDDFLIGKEDHVEEVMWAAIYAYQEMAAFLRDVAEREPHDTGATEDERRRRQRQAETMAARLRQLFEEDHRIRLEQLVPDSGQARE